MTDSPNDAPGSRDTDAPREAAGAWDRLEEILLAVNGRWAARILLQLAHGISRHADLRRAVNAAGYKRPLSVKVMGEVLARLGEDGLVRRAEVTGPDGRVQVHYWLTPRGHQLVDQLALMGAAAARALEADGRGLPAAREGQVEQVAYQLGGRDATPAGIWDVLIGGLDNVEADRRAAAAAAAAMPSLPLTARTTRRIQVDTVRRLVTEHGVRQFLDIGTGLPRAGAAHEIAQMHAPESRVAYVDNDPRVMTAARALLASSPAGACDFIHADLRQPEQILQAASRTLDLGEPVAILLVAALHFISDAEDPWGIVRRLVTGTGGDTYLVVIHGASDILPAQTSEASRRYNRDSAVLYHPRDRAAIARFFEPARLLSPGLVPLRQWWGPDLDPGEDLAAYAGLGFRTGGRPGLRRRGRTVKLLVRRAQHRRAVTDTSRRR